MIRVADFIAEKLSSLGIEHVFLVTGGGMMFLSDGLAQSKTIKTICTHHEQAAAMAAVAYAKYRNSFSSAYFTTGCGGTNAITGLLNAWQDSTSCIFISGQSKRKETVRNSGLPLRQFGVQEADIIAGVQPYSKYAFMVNDPLEIAYHLEKAIFLAKVGRPGPVWIDVPLDVQGAMIDPAALKHFNPEECKDQVPPSIDPKTISEIVDLLKTAKRPVILAGAGIKLSGSISKFQEFVKKTGIPVVSSTLGKEALPYDHELYRGQIGNKGTRAGNFTVQNADLLLVLGCRLSVSATGHEYSTFAREAKIIVIDADPIEHKKNTVRIDKFIHADLTDFFSKIRSDLGANYSEWVAKTADWKNKWPVYQNSYAHTKGGINLYQFTETLSQKMRSDSVVIADSASSFYVCAQSIRLKDNQRYITSGGQAEMGYTIPACVGASFAHEQKEIIGVTGDGSFQMNIQELQTIVHHKLPIKLFILNNDGYLSIRATQSKFFNKRFLGTDKDSGISFPSLKKIAQAYGIKFFKATSAASLSSCMEKVLAHKGPVICEVLCLKEQEIVPTVSSIRKDDGSMVSKPLEDMYPFLEREEFKREMIVKPVAE